jgi:hypothetical protein
MVGVAELLTQQLVELDCVVFEGALLSVFLALLLFPWVR